jgi:hypothetical protein
MFDIVPSLGPQSQVLHPAEASVFVQVGIPSIRSAIDTHYKYLLQNYTFTMFPQERSSTATGARHPSQVLIGSCPTHNPRLPIRRSGKGSARPRCNLITSSHICGGNFQQARTIISYIPIPQISLIVAMAYNKSFLSMGIKEYGKINGHASSSHHTQFGSVAYLASSA